MSTCEAVFFLRFDLLNYLFWIIILLFVSGIYTCIAETLGDTTTGFGTYTVTVQSEDQFFPSLS